MHEIVENFHPVRVVEPRAAEQAEVRKIFVVGSFRPANNRLLLKRLPPPKEGLIVKPQIAVEQSEYGYVVAVGDDVDVPLDQVAKFSRFSAEEIHFEDEAEGDEYVLAYAADIRGWFEVEEPAAGSGLLDIGRGLGQIYEDIRASH